MSFKKLVDATMKHGDTALAEISVGDTNTYALSWWTKNLGYVSEAMSDEEGDYHHEVRKDKRLDQETDFGRHPPSGTERGRQYQKQLAKDQKRNTKEGEGDGRMVFGPNYNPKMKYTDLGQNAPSQVDYVMTSDGSGRGVVVDAWQNNDGYYVFFTVELIDGEMDGVKKDYHISAIKKIPKNEMHPTESEGDPRPNNNYYDDAGTAITGPDDNNRDAWAPDEVAGWYDDEGNRKGIDTRESEGDDPEDIEWDAHWAHADGDEERGNDLEWDAEWARQDARRDARRNESIRVNHPIHGNGIVEAITKSHIKITWDNLDKRLSVSNTIPFAEAKYLTRLKEEYTDDVEDARVGNAKTNLKRVKKGIDKDMKKNQKVDESLVAMGMAPIGGTHRGTTKLSYVEDDIIRFDDLLEDGDEWKQPWNEEEGEDTDDSSEGGVGSENRKPDQNSTKGADYTNVPRPADSVLTNQDNQQSYSADPLSTKAGFESAGDGSEPDGDYQDINPVDAPETPQIRDLEGSSDRGNTRDTGGDSGDTSEVDAGDYDESKPEDNDGGENKMKNESTSAWLTADDLGINLMESNQGFGSYDDDDLNEHDMGSGEIAFTKELLSKLIASISAQAPDQATMDALCAGLESAQSEKGDAGLDVSDWDSIKSAAAAAYGGGGDDMGGDMGDPEMGGDMGGEEGDPVGDEGGEDEFGDEESDYEDQAVGDGEVAGAEGGEEHEGKTKMMDNCGDDMNEKKVDVDGNRPGRRNKGPSKSQSMKRRQPKKSQQLEGEGSGTPIGTGSSSGSGGGNQTDLSKPKSYKGKPVGTGTSGAGGSNANEFGQKPTKDGGSNNVPEYESGNQLGAESTPFGSDAESPAPRSSKPLAAEGKKDSRKKIDEAICLGMSSIPGVIRGDYADVPDDADWDDELKMIKRRAGMENWWKD